MSALGEALHTAEAAIVVLDTVRDCYSYGAWSEWTARKRAAEDRATDLLTAGGFGVASHGNGITVRSAGLHAVSAAGLGQALCNWRRRARNILLVEPGT